MGLLVTNISKILRPLAISRRMDASSRIFWHLFASILIFLLAFGAIVWRIDRAPDVFTDEILYTRLGIRVGGEGALVWDTGRLVVIHPPLFFLTQGAFLTLTSHPRSSLYTPGDIFAWVYNARMLNAILAGLTATLLYWLGYKLRGRGLGLLLATLFLLDPFGIRINRRAMIETMAALVTLSGLAVLLISSKDGRRAMSFAVVAGLLLGAGLLTKELTITTVLALLFFGGWEVWRSGRAVRRYNLIALSAPFVAAAIALFTYALFPVWVLVTGNWDRYLRVKTLSVQRLLGLVHTSGWNRPGVSFLDFLVDRLVNYGSSYLLLALGGVATVSVLYLGRNERAGRLLGIWGLVLFPFYALVALFGSGNDQFFYFLLVPSIVLVGYAFMFKPDPMRNSPQKLERWLTFRRWALAALIFALLPFNLLRWWTAYGVGQDDAYHQLASYVESHVPEGASINASGDDLKFQYFFPEHGVSRAATPQEALDLSVSYFVLALKDVRARYGRVTPELADWILIQGEEQFTAAGDSYGDVFLYHVSDERSEGTSTQAAPNEGPFTRTFAPATTGFVNGFVVALAMWTVACFGLAGWLFNNGHSLPRLMWDGARIRRARDAEGGADGLS